MKYTIIIFIIALMIVSQFYYLNYYPGTETVVYENNINSLPAVNISLAGDFNISNTFTVMTYNINYGIGPDNNYDLKKIADVIISSGANIIGLNEVDYRLYRTNFSRQVQHLADYLDMNYVFGPNLKTGWGSYGNVFLSTYPIIETRNIRLPGKLFKEPRGVLFNTLLLPDGSRLHVLVTHLATDYKIRQKQLTFLDKMISDLKYPFIIMGDFNQEVAELSGLTATAKNTIKSYPASAPDYAIDLIFTSHHLQTKSFRTINSQASDHLPVITRISPVEKRFK